MALGHGGETTVDDLIAQADDALYEAKRLGRDRTVWADDGHARQPTVAALPA